MDPGFLIKITNRPETFNRSFVLIGNGSEPGGGWVGGWEKNKLEG